MHRHFFLFAVCLGLFLSVGGRPQLAWAQADDDEDLLGELAGDAESESDSPFTPDDEAEPVDDLDPDADVEAAPAASESSTDEIGSQPTSPTEDEGSEPSDESAAAKETPAPSSPRSTVQDPRTLDRVKAVQRKPVLKRLRVEANPMVAMSLNDAFFTHYGTGGSVVFYPHDNFGLGISGLYLFAHPKTDNLKVVRQGLTSVPAVFEAPDFFVTADFYWVPIYGKIALFDRTILHFDLYAFTGAGMARAGDETAPAVVPGIGQRVLLNEWMAIRVEVRDYIFMGTQEVNNQKRSDVQNFLMLQAGLSFFIPPSFDYTR